MCYFCSSVCLIFLISWFQQISTFSFTEQWPQYIERGIFFLFHFKKYWAKQLLESVRNKKISKTPTLSSKSLPFSGDWKITPQIEKYILCQKGGGTGFMGETVVFSWWGIRQCMKGAAAFKVHLEREVFDRGERGIEKSRQKCLNKEGIRVSPQNLYTTQSS